ncbi:MAG: hypothetical protein FWE16_00610 [Firmicutes bacterium]|nr:hypothetical protein [Bacillota bacterium]
MYAKIKFNQIGDLVQISQFSGSAPCQILSLNSAKCEEDLVGREIQVRIVTAKLVREVGSYYVVENGIVTLR